MHALTEFGQEIFNDRYTLFPQETWEEACKRVATHVAMAERYDDTKTIRDEFYNILIDNHFMPAGRIWAGAGRPKANLLNCFCLPPTSDSREGWGQAIKEVIIIAGMGGGVGLNCSEIRPYGDPIKGTGGQAGGPLAFMEILNSMGEVIRASGGRRMALLLGLQLNHPDIKSFIGAKADLKKLNNANVSVMIPPNGAGTDFYRAVKKDGDYPLMWNDRVRSSIKAKELWQTVVTHAITTAEPGIINLHLMNKMNNIGYYKPIVCTNPCLTGDMKLLTVDGYKTLRELWESGGRKEYNGTKDTDQYGYQNIMDPSGNVTKATNVYRTSLDSEIYKIKCETSEGMIIEVKATPNHKFYKVRNDDSFSSAYNTIKVELKDLSVGDLLPTRMKFPIEIKEITKVDNEETFCLTELKSNTIIINELIVGNCSEIALESYGACDLGSLVLPKFVENNVMNWDKLASVIRSAVRFLDNVLDVTNYPLQEIESNTKQLRRLGLGITGLHDWLILQGYKYDYKGIDQVEELMRFVRDEAYKASCELSAQKGSFPVYNHSKFMESEFIKGLPPHIKGLITQKGIRNCALLSIPPTGTTSIVCGVSSGIEPIFSLGFKRTLKTENGKEERYVVHPLIERLQAEKMDIKNIQTTYDIDIRTHLEMQKVCQKYVCNAISKTINAPNSIMKDKEAQADISDLLLEYIPFLKGVTIYADGCRGDAPIQGMSLEDVVKLSGCKSGTCTI